ncbi:hypothetical protein Nmel_010809, partial [Mimus melanotis]
MSIKTNFSVSLLTPRLDIGAKVRSQPVKPGHCSGAAPGGQRGRQNKQNLSTARLQEPPASSRRAASGRESATTNMIVCTATQAVLGGEGARSFPKCSHLAGPSVPGSIFGMWSCISLAVLSSPQPKPLLGSTPPLGVEKNMGKKLLIAQGSKSI